MTANRPIVFYVLVDKIYRYFINSIQNDVWKVFYGRHSCTYVQLYEYRDLKWNSLPTL